MKKKEIVRSLWRIFLAVVVNAHFVSCQTCQRADRAEVRGDVILGGMFNIHEKGIGGRQCSGRIDPEAIQRLEAFLFALEAVNKQAIIREKIGLLAYDTCDENARATNRGLELLSKRNLDINGETCGNAPYIVGCIGDNNSGTTRALASLLTSAKVTQISFAASSSTLTKDFPFLVRTVPSSTNAVKATLDVIRELNWQDIAIVHVNTEDMEDRKKQLLGIAGTQDICVVSVITMETDMTNVPQVIRELFNLKVRGISGFVLLTPPETTRQFFTALKMAQFSMPSLSDLQWVMGTPFVDAADYNQLKGVVKGLVSIHENSNLIPEFRSYFTKQNPSFNPRNPWFRQYWEQTYNCTVGVTCGRQHIEQHRRGFQQAHGVTQTIAAVLTYVYALRDAREDLCPGQADELCQPLRLLTAQRLTTYIKAVSFVNLDGQVVSYTKDGDLSNDLYSITNVQLDGVSYRTQTVGTWDSRGGLQMKGKIKMYDMLGNLTSTYPHSFCRFDCSCHNQVTDFKFGSIDGGSALLHGFFDIHGSAGGQDCDQRIKPNTVQALEAFYFAVDHINNHPRILPRMQLGVTVSDTCTNPHRAKQQARTVLKDKLNYHSHNDIPLETLATLDATSADVAMHLAHVVGAYGVPQISTKATTAYLGNKDIFPSLLRTVGTNSDEMSAIVDVIKEFNWNYVKLVFSDNAYGKDSAEQFIKQAALNSICVATQVQLTDNIIHDFISISNIVRYYLLEAFPKAKVVVLLVSETHMQSLFEVLDKVLGGTSHDLIWISGHTWGTKPAIVQGHSKLAHGAITIEYQSSLIKPFMRYFKNLHSAANTRNPWFQEFWQHHFECFLSSDFAKVFNKTCEPGYTLQNDNIAMSPEVPYVIDGVYTFALALHKLLEDFCGSNTSSICQAAETNIHQLYSYMKEVKFYNGLTNMTVSFDSLGNGMSNFKIFNYQIDQKGQYLYYEVGSWHEGHLSLTLNDIVGPLTIGRPTKAKLTTSNCNQDSCMCSSTETTDLQYEVQYARLTLLAYFPIHESKGEFCNKLRTEGFIANQAFQYAIQRVNNDPRLLPNVTLGFMTFDTCSDSEYASRTFNAFDKNLRFFGQTRQLPVLTYVHAFIGGIDDNETKSLNAANYAGQRLIQISPYAASSSLSDKIAYPYFLRTVGNEENEVLALFSLLRSLDWSYVSLVRSSTGKNAAHAELVRDTLKRRGICIATEELVKAHYGPPDYIEIVKKLVSFKGAIGVVLIISSVENLLLFDAIRKVRAVGRLQLLGTSHWEVTDELIKEYNDVLRGALIINSDIGSEPYFDAFMQRLQADSPSNTPWIQEFWQEYFQCRLQYGSPYPKICDGTETLQHKQFSHPLAVYTINAVYAFAYGLTRLFQERCGGMVMPPCDAILTGQSTSTLLYDYIRNSHFLGADSRPFSFTSAGDAHVNYSIHNYQLDYSKHKGKFIKVGTWGNNQLQLNRSEVHFYNEESQRMELRSVCLGICNCSQEPIVLHLDRPSLHMVTHLTVWGIIVIAISLLGILLALICALFFMLRYRHPVVLGATSSLSLMLLGAVSSMYLLNFAFMLSDTPATCAVRRFFFGIFYALVFSVLLIKVIRIGRICNKAALSSKPSFISGQSQTAIACLLSFIQVALATEWLVLQPPDIAERTETFQGEYNQAVYLTKWTCNHSRKSLVVSLTYVYALVLLTFIFAFRARKAANYQQEALCTLLSAASVMVTLSAWAPLYILLEPSWATAVLCIAMTTSASAVFAFVFTPKMLILTASHAGAVPSETHNNIDCPTVNAVVKTRERDIRTSFRNSHPFPMNELSEAVYNPYSSRQTEAF